MTMDLKGWLFGRVLRLQEQSMAGVPWRPSVYSVDRARFESVGVVRGDVYFRGDPPAFVIMNGEPVAIEGRV